jgi:hypothetical protein
MSMPATRVKRRASSPIWGPNANTALAASARGMGMPNLALVIVPHPIGGISPEEVKVKAGNIFDMVIARLLDK